MSSTTVPIISAPPQAPAKLTGGVAAVGVMLVLPMLLLASTSVAAPAGETNVDARVEFNRDIRPIFVSHCSSCHGGVKQQGGISFVYPEQVLPPDGWVVEPGDPDASALIERVSAEDPDLRMPPPQHGPPLSPREIKLLRDWIADGAVWRRHWAFERPTAGPLPEVKDKAWPRVELDYHVLAKREAAGFSSPPDTAPHRWLRRASLDLIGLPPTPEEVDRFARAVSERGEAAYQQAADRLLASPRFGERWASVWLDQVRYADSQGLGLDSPRTIWQYRDWVIRALNADMPYDQFTIKQIAGDLLPGLHPADQIATACHRLTQTNEEGGTDDEEFRVAAVLDRVNTTWQAWQGLTFGCAQCHSHPYEPIRHEDYYRFVAFFNNTVDSDLGNDAPLYPAPNDPSDYQRAGKLDREIRSVRESIWNNEYSVLTDEELWSPLKGLTASANNATRLEVEQGAQGDEFYTVGAVQTGAKYKLEANLPAGDEPITAIRVVVLPAEPESAVADSEWGFVLSHVRAELVGPNGEKSKRLEIARVVGDEPHPLFDPQESLNGKSNRGFSAFSRIYYPRQAALILASPVEAAPGSRLRLRIAHDVQAVGAFGLISKRGRLATATDARFTELLTSSALTQQKERLAALQARRDRIEATPTPVMQQRPTHLARETHVFERGLFLDKGELVTPGVPASLPAMPADVPQDRLALANWLVSPENPLTARVEVNRVWSRLFGVGIVETEEDFGSSGEPPSHPALLDHLAVRFQGELGWSLKRLLRELVLSSVYRQSEVVTADSLKRDPNNRLLTRGPRHRLSSEVIRDQALALSGLLLDKMGGPPVRPPIPDGVWRPFAAGDLWPSPERGDPARYRRSIYTYTKRSIPYPMYATFDQPSREFCTPRRLRSNTPLQALETLNSESFDECAEKLAGRLAAHSASPREQIAWGFRLAACRPPTDVELRVLMELHDQSEEGDGLHAVAHALLNLDEVLMK